MKVRIWKRGDTPIRSLVVTADDGYSVHVPIDEREWQGVQKAEQRARAHLERLGYGEAA